MALKCGIKPFEFWDYTIQEVNDLMVAYSENQRQDMQFKAVCAYNTGLVVAKELRLMFSKEKHDVAQLTELFPTLFDDDKTKEEIERQKHIKKEEQIKARLIAYNEAWKGQHRKG